MNTISKTSQDEVLDQETLALIGSAASRFDVSLHDGAGLRDRVMNLVDEDGTATDAEYVTIRSDDGVWTEIGPLTDKKVLNIDRSTGIESYLMRMRPGAQRRRHQHEKDELCIVLEGDVAFDNIELKAGDYHLARKGSWHGVASSIHGALIFVQAAVASPAHSAV